MLAAGYSSYGSTPNSQFFTLHPRSCVCFLSNITLAAALRCLRYPQLSVKIRGICERHIEHLCTKEMLLNSGC
ncbi:hypothetical protein SAMN04487894_12430 [Niabella drilacis]|uniref:Uncharacterized protein n=1 Tax=Niabella drilacis (strain DSM 25811 / CCM 8410 / CCUG 62505 / LMG 26954 / E90) TaxID=1285928 RepID=A0A1G7AMS9_NIADE|nr:hypothetical protein SAMN04487894_12430 [Niabella drilacis]